MKLRCVLGGRQKLSQDLIQITHGNGKTGTAASSEDSSLPVASKKVGLPRYLFFFLYPTTAAPPTTLTSLSTPLAPTCTLVFMNPVLPGILCPPYHEALRLFIFILFFASGLSSMCMCMQRRL